ncbi:roadblock/LC7 domain-containing protein [Micromonospora sp. NBC_01813]|uniref:roadblock/LC7 domain-containing protein n=1 Tax=Micromonospora sp. NBC_01813 TaxID=2975988 RepID=UPI002DDBAE6B|nr:roadblock/LC7 domain-containing protein [Micromonospora sp. NBC_01813]WSA09346.1 roadblock/LC7 domain-containing protein [Micromonospora sp. NBC_01813]
MDTDTAILTELHGLRRRVPEVAGSVLAGVDGLMISRDLTDTGTDADSIAALAAASIGLGRRFAVTSGHGELRETVIAGTHGYVALYAAGSRALLAVLAGPGADLPLLHTHARRVAQLVDGILQTELVTNVPDPDPSFLDNRAPLAVRTPMATLPYNPALPRRRF